MSEVQLRNDGADVIVRVKNGVPYATAEINRAGSAATGTIRLNVVRRSGAGRDLLEALVDGC